MPARYAIRDTQSPDRPLVCAPCTATALRARRWTLERLRGAHERARADVASALSRSEESRRKKSHAPSGDAQSAVRATPSAVRSPDCDCVDARRSRLAALRASVEAARSDVTRRAAANASRAAALREASRLLRRRRAELFSLGGAFAEGRRALAMRARAAEDAFAREACFALADLKTLVPVAAERPDPETRRRRDVSNVSKKLFSQQKRERTKSVRRAFPEDDDDFGVPTAVRVFGFRAPDPGDLAEFRAEELGAALGALLLFTETASNAIGAARLARGDGAGSDRARVWVPESYFEESSLRRDVTGGSPPDALPLYLPRDVVEANGGGDRAAAARRCAAERESVGSVGARVKGTMAGIAATGATAAAALARANFVADRTTRTPRTPGKKTAAVLTAGSPSQFSQLTGRDPGDPAVLARHRAELHRALATLHRHAGATCVELERVLGDVAAPAKWGPFASLAFLVTEASRRARAARDAERRADSLTDVSRARSNPFFDDDDDELELSLKSSDLRFRVGDVGAGDVRDGDVGAGDVRSERRSVFSRAPGGNGGFHGKQSLMTSVFGGGGTVGGVRRDVSASSGAPASKGGGASRARGAGGRRVETRKSYASPSDASVADLAADGWDLVEHPARAAAGRCAEGLGLRAKKNADEPAMLPPPPSAPEDVEHWTRAMYVDARR